ncbi:transposase [Actinacidiphila glaucinigra]|uniref:transposase n=1 Tax=Actinacidiphila glaucinigra TaxID=235986 RepID=UPI0036E7621F
MARGDLTDEQWALLEPLLPVRKKVGRPATWTRRQLIDGIRFRVRTGVPWRDVPERYGPWGRVYDLFRRWQRDGTWQRVSDRLHAREEAKDVITWAPVVGADVNRVRRRIAPARHRTGFDGNRLAVSPQSR